MQIPIPAARSLVEANMVALGHTDEEAGVIADHLIDCELRGLAFGGLARALSIAERFQESTDARDPITVRQQTTVSASLDGGDQVGYLVGSRATDVAIELARTSGLAVVGASRTWYTGMFSYYLERITAAGFAGMIAGSGGAIVAPHGGTQARFSTNPIAFGFPSTTGPVIWDIGTAGTMLGEVMLAARLGQELPEGKAFDVDGAPTRNPAAALQGGALSVWGGHKGSGLAMVVQLLGMMCGQPAAPAGIADCGFLVLVIDPGLLTDSEEFQRQVSEYAGSVRATRPLDPDTPVRVPFERSAAERDQRRAAGVIDVPEPVLAALNSAAGSRTPSTT